MLAFKYKKTKIYSNEFLTTRYEVGQFPEFKRACSQ